MWITSKKSWYRFVYDLLYPAILGSMIYDIADIGSTAFASSTYWFKYLILAFYCIDYLFLYNSVRLPVTEHCGFKIALDSFIAVLYRVSFSFAAIQNYRASLSLMAIVLICLMVYLKRSKVERIFLWSLTISLALYIALSFAIHVSPRDITFFTWGLLGTFLLYLLYACFFAPESHPVKMKVRRS